MTNLLRVADWLAWWGLVSLIAFFLFATFAHIVDLLFFPESDPEKPRQALWRDTRSGVPLQEGGVSNFASKGVMLFEPGNQRKTGTHPEQVSDGVTHPSENTFSQQAAKGFDRRVS